MTTIGLNYDRNSKKERKEKGCCLASSISNVRMSVQARHCIHHCMHHNVRMYQGSKRLNVDGVASFC